MPVYDDGTMDVRVNGKTVRRRFSINRDVASSNRYMERVMRYEPELLEGEVIQWNLGDDVPLILSLYE